MLSTKKILYKILQNFGVDYYTMRNYTTISTSFSITPKPYQRYALILPTFFNVNSLKYKLLALPIAANASTITVPYLIQDGGTLVQTATAIDAHVFLVRINP